LSSLLLRDYSELFYQANQSRYDFTVQSFSSYEDIYILLEEIYSNVCCFDADYGDRPYYEISEVKE
tara:strand:- start:1430 stop:1627 length:198 start_codon:yes stop_codon:yes gene_type:complete